MFRKYNLNPPFQCKIHICELLWTKGEDRVSDVYFLEPGQFDEELSEDIQKRNRRSKPDLQRDIKSQNPVVVVSLENTMSEFI